MKKLFSNKSKMLPSSLLIALCIFVSCKKLIEIPPNPPSYITKGEVFADSVSTMTAVASVYTYTYGGGMPYSDGQYSFATALAGHEISSSFGEDPRFYSYTLTPSTGKINLLWTAPYKGMYLVNDILSGITNNSKLPASFVKQITGEMKVVRAFYYFNLVNLFGAVPLVTNTDYAANAQLPRSSVAAVYTQILADLNDAIKDLPVSYPSAGHARPNRYTALALLAKVHLYQGNWQAAYDGCDSVIRLGGFSLVTNLNEVFLDGSSEAIWQLPILSSSQGSADASQYLPFSNTDVPRILVTDSLLNQFETGDLRKTSWLGMNVVNGQNLYYPAKYKDQMPTSPATNYMMLRLAEQYLIRAEAAAQINTITSLNAAMADIGTIRRRAGLTTSTVGVPSQKAVLALVRKERRTELFCEWANRWFDLNRTSADNKYPSSGQAPSVLAGWQPNFALFPIPQTQRQLNSHLTQNPGYN